MQDNILSQEEVIALLESGAERVECEAIFRQWKYTRRGYITRRIDPPNEVIYEFSRIEEGKTEIQQVFFPGLNPCTLYRLQMFY
jgi:hypothetical protein